MLSPEDPWARALVGDQHTDSKVIRAAAELRTEPETSLDWLEEAVEQGDPQLLKLRWPLFDPLRRDERFDVILRRTFNG